MRFVKVSTQTPVLGYRIYRSSLTKYLNFSGKYQAFSHNSFLVLAYSSIEVRASTYENLNIDTNEGRFILLGKLINLAIFGRVVTSKIQLH
jgi:hypothetical protein